MFCDSHLNANDDSHREGQHGLGPFIRGGHDGNTESLLVVGVGKLLQCELLEAAVALRQAFLTPALDQTIVDRPPGGLGGVWCVGSWVWLDVLGGGWVVG